MINKYLTEIFKKAKTSEASERSYYPVLENLLNLHGSSKRREKTPENGKDENVFDIQQGVSIVLMLKMT